MNSSIASRRTQHLLTDLKPRQPSCAQESNPACSILLPVFVLPNG